MDVIKRLAVLSLLYVSFVAQGQKIGPPFEVDPINPLRTRSLIRTLDMTLPPSNVEWRRYNLHIDIDAKAPNGTKGTRTDLVVDEGFFFCGWKVVIYSASKHAYRADGITGKGFTFTSSVAASRSDFNKENAWFLADVNYRAFKVLEGGIVPACNSDGFSTAPSGMNAQPAWGSSSCSGKVMMCKESPQSSGIPCGICTGEIPIP